MKKKIIILTTIFLITSCYEEKKQESYQDIPNKVKQNTEVIIKDTEEIIKEGKKTFNNFQNNLKKENK